MTPRSLLIYRYLQMAVSMAVDMHLDIDPSIVVRQSNQYTSDLRFQLSYGESSNRSREAFRAALGCFYVSSVYV
jgi:hypothetical protein